jgi:hypothetical protein
MNSKKSNTTSGFSWETENNNFDGNSLISVPNSAYLLKITFSKFGLTMDVDGKNVMVSNEYFESKKPVKKFKQTVPIYMQTNTFKELLLLEDTDSPKFEYEFNTDSLIKEIVTNKSKIQSIENDNTLLRKAIEQANKERDALIARNKHLEESNTLLKDDIEKLQQENGQIKKMLQTINQLASEKNRLTFKADTFKYVQESNKQIDIHLNKSISEGKNFFWKHQGDRNAMKFSEWFVELVTNDIEPDMHHDHIRLRCLMLAYITSFNARNQAYKYTYKNIVTRCIRKLNSVKYNTPNYT